MGITSWLGASSKGTQWEPGDAEVTLRDTLLPAHSHACCSGCTINCKLGIITLPESHHREQAGEYDPGNLLNTLNYVSLPHLPAARFTVFFFPLNGK